MGRVRVFELVAVTVLLPVVFIPLYYWHWHQKHIRAAEEHQYIAQALFDHKAEHGALPANLEDLVPGFLPKKPLVDGYNPGDGMDGYFVIRTGPGRGPERSHVIYQFGGAEPGWSTSGFWDSGPLPVPAITSPSD
jgi:hypothetical protein